MKSYWNLAMEKDIKNSRNGKAPLLHELYYKGHRKYLEMEDFVVTCPYFTRKSGTCYNKRESPSSHIQNFSRAFQPSEDQRGLFSQLSFASIMGNLPEITLQYLWVGIIFQRMEIKSSFQDSIYTLFCAPLCHAVNLSWVQLNFEIKNIHKRSCFCKPAPSPVLRGC